MVPCVAFVLSMFALIMFTQIRRDKLVAALRPCGCLSILLTMGFGLACAPLRSAAQTAQDQSQSMPAWEKAAGGKMAFAVASIRRVAKGSPFAPPNFSLNVDDETIPAGGILTADQPLQTYIEFAYKIMPTTEQEHAMFAHLPGWVTTDRFFIQAKAEDSASNISLTKDQMRLMMQALLADRFKLAVHFETHILPALALVSIKPGKTGPRLRPHAQGLSCEAKWIEPPDRSSPTVPPGEFIPACGNTGAIGGPNRTVLLGSRDASIEAIADYLATLGSFGRPLIDQTGLNGRFDYSLYWMPEPYQSGAQGSQAVVDGAGPTLQEALKEQLGLRLKPVNAPVKVLVIDHVELSSPN